MWPMFMYYNASCYLPGEAKCDPDGKANEKRDPSEAVEARADSAPLKIENRMDEKLYNIVNCDAAGASNEIGST